MSPPVLVSNKVDKVSRNINAKIMVLALCTSCNLLSFIKLSFFARTVEGADTIL